LSARLICAYVIAAVLALSWVDTHPSPVRIVATVTILVITAGRLLLRRSGTDDLLNMSMLLSAAAVTMCDPGFPLSSPLRDVWIRQASLDIWRFLFIVSAAYLLWYCVNAREQRRGERFAQAFIVSVTGVSIFAMCVMSASRPQDALLHQVPSTQLTVYFWAYAVAMTMLCGPAVAIFLTDAVRGGSYRQVIFATAAALLAIAGLVSIINIAVGVSEIVSGTADQSTVSSVETRIHGGFMAVFLAPLYATVTPSLVRNARERLGMDRSSKLMARVQPMWSDLVREVPEVRFRLEPADIKGESRTEAARRMVAETADAAMVLLGREAAQQRLSSRSGTAEDEAEALRCALTDATPAVDRPYRGLRFPIPDTARFW
jgi:hypothetical protein